MFARGTHLFSVGIGLLRCFAEKECREFVKELRGDRRREAMDIYDHIDQNELRQAYLACIPKLGV
jgi:hypothetical protein